MRYFATKHLRLLYRSGVASFSAWGIQLLNKQVPHHAQGPGSIILYQQFARVKLGDEHAKVFQMALTSLDEACETPECLDTFVKCRPSLSLLLGFVPSAPSPQNNTLPCLPQYQIILTLALHRSKNRVASDLILKYAPKHCGCFLAWLMMVTE